MDIIRKVHVNAPFGFLVEKHLDWFIQKNINPEIGLDAKYLDRFSHDAFMQTAKKLHSKNLSVTFHGPFNDLSPGSSDPLIWKVTKQRYEQVLRLVPVFRPKTLVCHAGYDWKRFHFIREEWIEKSLDMWSWLASRLEDEGAVLTLENVYEHYPEDLKMIFQGLADKNVGFCFDIGHQSAFSRTSAKHWIEVLGPFLAQLHIHDNDGTQDQHKGLGTASIEFPAFFKRLKTIRNVPPVVTLETHQEEDLFPSLEYLEKIWPW
ncbi:MAG: sugar phosphate isomerase/epimerase family protein [Desulfobacterales bacterium]